MPLSFIFLTVSMLMCFVTLNTGSHDAVPHYSEANARKTGDSVQSFNAIPCMFQLLPCNSPGIAWHMYTTDNDSTCHSSLLQVIFLQPESCQLRSSNLSYIVNLVPCVSYWNWRNTDADSTQNRTYFTFTFVVTLGHFSVLLHCDIPVPESCLLGLFAVFVGVQLELSLSVLQLTQCLCCSLVKGRYLLVAKYCLLTLLPLLWKCLVFFVEDG